MSAPRGMSESLGPGVGEHRLSGTRHHGDESRSHTAPAPRPYVLAADGQRHMALADPDQKRHLQDRTPTFPRAVPAGILRAPLVGCPTARPGQLPLGSGMWHEGFMSRSPGWKTRSPRKAHCVARPLADWPAAGPRGERQAGIQDTMAEAQCPQDPAGRPQGPTPAHRGRHRSPGTAGALTHGPTPAGRVPSCGARGANVTMASDRSE